MCRLSYPFWCLLRCLSTINNYTDIDNTFSSVEGAATPTPKNVPTMLFLLMSSLMFIYHHYPHIDNTFSRVEGGYYPNTEKCAVDPIPSLFLSLMFVYHHYLHIDNAFSSVEGATTPTLKNVPTILSPLLFSLMFIYHHMHIDNTFSRVEGATTPTPKNASTIISYTHIDNTFSSIEGVTTPKSWGHKFPKLGTKIPRKLGTIIQFLWEKILSPTFPNRKSWDNNYSHRN